MRRLGGKRIAILATDRFEQSKLLQPLEALREEGALVEIVSPKDGVIQGMDHMIEGQKVTVDTLLENALPANYDAIVLPGGVHNSDALRVNEHATDFVRSFFEDKKPVAAICHAPLDLDQCRRRQGPDAHQLADDPRRFEECRRQSGGSAIFGGRDVGDEPRPGRSSGFLRADDRRVFQSTHRSRFKLNNFDLKRIAGSC